jgi:hypothetical protein
MDNDKKTTLFGFVRSAFITTLSGVAYFGGAALESQISGAESAGDWAALILAAIAGISAVIDFYTNKPDKPEVKK